MKLQTPITAFTVMAFVSANHFIYYLKKIPLIRNLVPDSIYGNDGLKEIVAVLVAILKSALRFGVAAFYVALLVALPASLLHAREGVPVFDSFVHILFVLSIVAGSLLSPAAFEPKREKYLLVQLMRIDSREYLSSVVLFRCLADFLCLLPLLSIATAILTGSAWQGAVLAVLIGCARLMGEAFHLAVYARTGFILSKNIKVVALLGALGLAAAYVPLFLGSPLPVSGVLLNPLVILAFLAGGLLAARYVIGYDRYPDIAIDTIKGMDFSVDPEKKMGEARFSNVKIREKDFSAEVLSSTKFDDKEGYAYLNAIFYQRHRRQLLDPVIVRLVVVAVALAACAVLSVLAPASSLSLGEDASAILPFFVFIMYIASIGDRACRAMFYNCDLALLRYPFYRQRDAILQNFKVRLLMVARLNLVIAVAISAAVVAASLLLHWNWPLLSAASFVLSVLVLSLFFSTHHLFLYYVFQPYTADLGMKNPFFAAINGIVYMLCFLSVQIDSPPSYFALLVIASTAAYIVVALFLVHRFAPRTFRVK